MPFESEDDLIDEISEFLLDVMILARYPRPPARFLSVSSFRSLYTSLVSLRDFLFAASNGDLSKSVSLKGYIGGTLKTLQANLKHMTWQTEMIASGDFSQRVEFMGEFSRSFNAMVVRLDRILTELAEKEMELRTVNDQLLKEISIRQEAEAIIRKNEEALRRLAMTDSLTGLYNRRYFNKIIEDEMSRSCRYSRPLAVIMFDIDFFKRINDALGHEIGDIVLKKVANITRDLVRATDTPSRYGGEEFIILLPETAVPDAFATAERLRRKIEVTTFQAKQCSIRITASFGVSDNFMEADNTSRVGRISELVSNADQAMYVSKQAGRNRVSVYRPEEDTWHR